jgi:hypothetical protein
MTTTIEILQELKKRTKNINPPDVKESETKRKNYTVFAYKSRERVDGRRNTFLYLRLPDSNNFVEGLLGTGSRPINDKKNITIPCHGYVGFPKCFKVTSDSFTEYGITYDYIEDLIRQCYKILDLPR